MSIIVRVPATTANLGPGFDCFGVAWQLYNDFEFTPGGDQLIIEGCPEEFRGENNLAWQGYLHCIRTAGLETGGMRIRFLETNVPVARGLGSSSALIVAGLVAANALHDLKMERRELLDIATEIEGHPDNVAPALLGGLTASMLDGSTVYSVPFRFHERLRCAALIPDFELSTALARSVLPAQVPRQDAIFNVSRGALLLKALETGDMSLLRPAMQDKLHQPYRLPLMPGCRKAAALAEELDCAFCISGAGSTLLYISDRTEFFARLKAGAAERFPAWKAVELRVDYEGGRVLEE